MQRQALDWRIKGLPPAAEGRGAESLGELDLDLLAGDLMLPAAVLRDEPLRRNVAAMQTFADSRGARLCPHGKTSMSPELFAMQLEAGAWGLTAATPHHVRIYRNLGVGRIFLANQLVDQAGIRFVVGEIAKDPQFDFYCLVDSPKGAALLARAAEGCPRPVQVLVEAGIAGGRTGVRSLAQALALARTVKRHPQLALRGIETYEGIHQTRPDARAEATAMLQFAVELAIAVADESLFAPGAIILSAGGSSFLDLCTAELPARIGGHELERVLRPGCYVTHDSGLYVRMAVNGPARGLPPLEHSLEVWGAVLSTPEPGLAVVGVGKRDASFDVEPPIPLWRHRPGRRERPAAAEDCRVLALWDQHLSLAAPPGTLAVGDLVGFGISHPCGTFDRWRAILTVDEDYRVTGAISTLF